MERQRIGKLKSTDRETIERNSWVKLFLFYCGIEMFVFGGLDFVLSLFGLGLSFSDLLDYGFWIPTLLLPFIMLLFILFKPLKTLLEFDNVCLYIVKTRCWGSKVTDAVLLNDISAIRCYATLQTDALWDIFVLWFVPFFRLSKERLMEIVIEAKDKKFSFCIAEDDEIFSFILKLKKEFQIGPAVENL